MKSNRPTHSSMFESSKEQLSDSLERKVNV